MMAQTNGERNRDGAYKRLRTLSRVVIEMPFRSVAVIVSLPIHRESHRKLARLVERHVRCPNTVLEPPPTVATWQAPVVCGALPE